MKKNFTFKLRMTPQERKILSDISEDLDRSCSDIIRSLIWIAHFASEISEERVMPPTRLDLQKTADPWKNEILHLKLLHAEFNLRRSMLQHCLNDAPGGKAGNGNSFTPITPDNDGDQALK